MKTLTQQFNNVTLHCGLPAPVEPKSSPCGLYGISIGKRADMVIFHKFGHCHQMFKETPNIAFEGPKK